MAIIVWQVILQETLTILLIQRYCRTTVKETTVENSDITNPKGASKHIVYDSEDIARLL